VRKELRSPAEPIVELDDVLRDALGDLLAAETRYSPVVDAHGRMTGVLSMDVISHALQVPAEETRTSTELLADE
jgi:CBS-domain-containing membrane protein